MDGRTGGSHYYQENCKKQCNSWNGEVGEVITSIIVGI